MADQIDYPPNPMLWTATVVSVHDGDTATFDVDLHQPLRRVDRDLGFHVHISAGRLRLHNATRLYGINAAELATPEGKTAQAALASILPVGASVMLDTWLDKADKYGRILARVSTPGGTDVNQWLVDQGHAAVYYGQGPKPVPAVGVPR